MTSKHNSRRATHRQHAARGYVLTNDFSTYRTSATAVDADETLAIATSDSVGPTTTAALNPELSRTLSTAAPSSSSSAVSSSTAISSSVISSSSSSSSSTLTSSSSSVSSTTSSTSIARTTPVAVAATSSATQDEQEPSTLVVTPTIRSTAVRSNLASASASAKTISAATTDSSSLSGGSIAGIVVALVVFVAAIITILIVRKKSRSRRQAATEAYASYMPDGDRDRVSAYEYGSDEIMGGAAMTQRSDGWRSAGGPRPPTMIESGRAGMGAGGAATERLPPAPSFNLAPQPSSPTVSSHSTDDYGFPDPRALGRASAANSSYLLAQSTSQASFVTSPLQQQTNFAGAPSHPYANTYPATPVPAQQIYQTPSQAAYYPQPAPPPELRVMTHSPPAQLQQHQQSQQQNAYAQPKFHALGSPPMQAAAVVMPAPSYTPHPAEQQYLSMPSEKSQARPASAEPSSSQARRSVYDTDDAYGGM